MFTDKQCTTWMFLRAYLKDFITYAIFRPFSNGNKCFLKRLAACTSLSLLSKALQCALKPVDFSSYVY